MPDECYWVARHVLMIARTPWATQQARNHKLSTLEFTVEIFLARCFSSFANIASSGSSLTKKG